VIGGVEVIKGRDGGDIYIPGQELSGNSMVHSNRKHVIGAGHSRYVVMQVQA
jgi:hypothetical protein